MTGTDVRAGSCRYLLNQQTLSNSYNEDGECHRKCRRNVIENVIEILRKIK